MRNTLFAFIAVLSLNLSTALAQGEPVPAKAVIDVQSLLNNNHSGIKALTRKAAHLNIALDWDAYQTNSFEVCEAYSYDCLEIIPSRGITNPNPATGQVDYVIKEVVGRYQKKGWKNYTTLKYELVDAASNEVLKSSDVLHEYYTGGCKPNGMCVQVWGPGHDKKLGTSKTKALVELMEYALTLKK